MKASRAHLASLGTTGVLIASSLLLLAVVSTIVAFRGWPGDGLVEGLESLLVDRDRPSLELTGPALLAADAAPAAAAVAAAPAAGTPAAAVLGGTGERRAAPAPFGTLTPAAPRTTPPPTGGGGGGTTPPLGGDAPGIAPPADVPGVTDGLADTTEEVTGGVGDTVGGVSPELGQGISDTGESVSDLVRGVGDSSGNLLK